MPWVHVAASICSQNQLDAAEKSIANLVKALEMGEASEALVNRMEELEAQKAALRQAVAEEEVQRGFRLTKEHILFFLEQFKKFDYTNRDCQRRLVEVFVDAIFLYDDGTIKIAFNFSGENNTVTLSEVDGAAEKGFVCCPSCSTKNRDSCSRKFYESLSYQSTTEKSGDLTLTKKQSEKSLGL